MRLFQAQYKNSLITMQRLNLKTGFLERIEHESIIIFYKKYLFCSRHASSSTLNQRQVNRWRNGKKDKKKLQNHHVVSTKIRFPAFQYIVENIMKWNKNIWVERVGKWISIKKLFLFVVYNFLFLHIFCSLIN